MGPEDWDLDDMFGYDDFIGSNESQEPMDSEDRFYDPSGITDVEEDELF